MLRRASTQTALSEATHAQLPTPAAHTRTMCTLPEPTPHSGAEAESSRRDAALPPAKKQKTYEANKAYNKAPEGYSDFTFLAIVQGERLVSAPTATQWEAWTHVARAEGGATGWVPSKRLTEIVDAPPPPLAPPPPPPAADSDDDGFEEAPEVELPELEALISEALGDALDNYNKQHDTDDGEDMVSLGMGDILTLVARKWADDKVIAAVRSLAETGAEGGDPLITITSGETPRIEFNLG